MKTNTFQIGQIVKGKVAGNFKIVAFVEIGGETYAKMKEVNLQTMQTAKGFVHLPLNAIA